MGQIISPAKISYYIELLNTLTSHGATLKSISIAQFNPAGIFEDLKVSTLDDLAKAQFPEFHIIAAIEHPNPSGLVNYSERYHFWQACGKNGIQTWIDIEGRVNTYHVRNFGITDAFGRFVRGLKLKR